MLNKSKVVKDFSYNFISSIIPIILLQIVIYPIVNKEIGNESYGLMITLVALFTLFSSSFGNVLNNIRLLSTNNDEKEESYIFVLLVLIILNILIVTFILTLVYDIRTLAVIFSVALISLLFVSRQFLLVYFRLNLDYKSILFSNLFLAIGYSLGLLLVIYANSWVYIYILGLLFSLIFMIFKIKRFRISDFRLRDIEFSEVKDILKNVSILIVAALLVSSITYFDRILLFPLLGATYVSIYYASSIFGKIISQLINPMSNVLLSHLVYFEKFVKVFFIKYLVIVTIVSICMIIGINIVAPLFLRLLYPDLYVLAEEYILFGAINAALIVIYSSMNPFLLKFFSFSWQIIVNLITFIFYVLLAYILSKNYGFNGFYIGIIISNFIRVLIMLIVIFIANTKDIKNSVPKKMILNES